MAVTAEGIVRCWGSNASGQCNVPPNLQYSNQVAAGGAHSLAIERGYKVRAWGSNASGQCNVPVGLTYPAQIAAGGEHSLALKTDGTVVAWGTPLFGITTVPSGLTNVVKIAAGNQHSLALRSNGVVVGWGNDTWGQCVPPVGMGPATEISAGWGHSLARLADGTVRAWGNNAAGQCNIPIGLTNVVDVAAGGEFSMALKSDGTVVCWGSNAHGECNVPALLPHTGQLAAGSNHALGLRSFQARLEDYHLTAGNGTTAHVVIVVPQAVGTSTLQLTSNNSNVSIARSTWDSFANGSVYTRIATSLHPTSQTATVTAHWMSRQIPLDIIIDPAFLSFYRTAIEVVGGSTSQVYARLRIAGVLHHDLTVGLSSTDPSVIVPATVTIPGGKREVYVPIGHVGVQTIKTSTVTATNPSAVSGSLTFRNLPMKVGTLQFSSASVQGGDACTGLIVLNGIPSTDRTVSLASQHPTIVSVPTTVTVPAGVGFVFFPVATTQTNWDTLCRVTATLSGSLSSTTQRLRVISTPTVKRIQIDRALFGNKNATGTITIYESAPVGGVIVNLSSNNTSALTVQSSVVIPAGQRTGNFWVQTGDVGSSQFVVITAAIGSRTTTKGVAVKPLTLDAFTLSTTSVVGGSPSVVTATITINTIVDRPTSITLESEMFGVVYPETPVVVLAGAKTVTVTLHHASVPFNTRVTLWAKKNGTVLAKSLLVRRQGP